MRSRDYLLRYGSGFLAWWAHPRGGGLAVVDPAVQLRCIRMVARTRECIVKVVTRLVLSKVSQCGPELNGIAFG